MENKNTRRGFTLIELLVVVLIVGILAAVAVPQYNKAVEKARWMEWFTTIDNLRKNAQLAFLSDVVSGNDDEECYQALEIFDGGGHYQTDNFHYEVEGCDSREIYVDTYRNHSGSWNVNIEVRFHPTSDKQMEVTAINPQFDDSTQQFFCDLIVNAYGKEVLDANTKLNCNIE